MRQTGFEKNLADSAADTTLLTLLRRSAGVVERGGLENRCASNGTGGSNPSSSAMNFPNKKPRTELVRGVQFELRKPAR